MRMFKNAGLGLAAVVAATLSMASSAQAQITVLNSNFTTVSGNDFGNWTESGITAINVAGDIRAQIANNGQISQVFNITLAQAGQYIIRFNAYSSGSADIAVLFGSLLGANGQTINLTGSDSTYSSNAFTIPSAGLPANFTLRFDHVGNSQSGNVILDDVTILRTPAPLAGAGLLSLFAGCFAVAGFHRRRRGSTEA